MVYRLASRLGAERGGQPKTSRIERHDRHVAVGVSDDEPPLVVKTPTPPLPQRLLADLRPHPDDIADVLLLTRTARPEAGRRRRTKARVRRRGTVARIDVLVYERGGVGPALDQELPVVAGAHRVLPELADGARAVG